MVQNLLGRLQLFHFGGVEIGVVPIVQMLVCLMHDNVVCQGPQKLTSIQLVSIKLAVSLLDLESDFLARLVRLRNHIAKMPFF